MVKLPKPLDPVLWLVEHAIKEKRRPLFADLSDVWQRGVASDLVLQYIEDLDNGKPPFKGRRPMSLDEILVKMEEAVQLINEPPRRGRNAPLTITAAVNEAAAKEKKGFGKSVLWEMIDLYEAHYDRPAFRTPKK